MFSFHLLYRLLMMKRMAEHMFNVEKVFSLFIFNYNQYYQVIFIWICSTVSFYQIARARFHVSIAFLSCICIYRSSPFLVCGIKSKCWKLISYHLFSLLFEIYYQCEHQKPKFTGIVPQCKTKMALKSLLTCCSFHLNNLVV